MKRFVLATIIFWLSFFLYPNFSSAIVTPNDVYYNQQWYFSQIKLPDAWQISTGSADVVVAVLDTGVDIDHPDLVNQIWTNVDEIAGDGIDNDRNGYIDDVYGWDFLTNSPDPNPKFDHFFTEVGAHHGTAVSSIIAAEANNNEGIAGVSWHSKIMPLRVIQNNGLGRGIDVVSGIDYAINNGADVINMSFVGFDPEPEMQKALERAYEAGVVVVGAAGNSSELIKGINLDKNPAYPACFNSLENNLIIGVVATDTLDQKAPFSNYGKNCVDIAAPGLGFVAARAYSPQNGFSQYYTGDWSGTSMAAPLVSGVVALVKSLKPGLSVAEAQGLLLDNGVPIGGINSRYLEELGRGRLDAWQTLSAAADTRVSTAEASRLMGVLTSLPLAISQGRAGDGQVYLFRGNFFVNFWPAYPKEFKGGINIAAGDLSGNGSRQIVTAVASAGGPQIKIFNQSGKLLGQFMAYEENFRGGVKVAVGDVDGDGRDEIITAPAVGHSPLVKVFDARGVAQSQFMAYKENFRGGVNLAVDDLDRNGLAEIITTPASAGGPHLRIFNGEGSLEGQFMAGPVDFRGGLQVAIGNFTIGPAREIAVSLSAGHSPTIKVFDTQGNLFSEFMAYGENFRGGVVPSAGDVDNDGFDDLITMPASAGGPHLRMFDGTGKLKGQFFVLDEKKRSGWQVVSR